jgi:succinoglycan biosynthesis transport protein ExoP
MALLPAVIKKPMAHTWAFLTSSRMKTLLEQAEKQFDFIVFDLPPMGPVVDAAAFAPQLDAFLFVVEWGTTARKLVRRTLDSNPRIRDRCLGIVLNKVNMKKLNSYESYGSSEYYSKSYGLYHHSS